MQKYKTQSIYWGLITIALFIGVMTTSVFDDLLLKEMEITMPEVVKEYKYNEQVPIEIVKDEIIKQADLFRVNSDKAIILADCESKFNNLAVNNQGSTATGIYMFIFSTWKATDSGKKHISPYNYKANIQETMIKLANGEFSHWLYCGRVAGFH